MPTGLFVGDCGFTTCWYDSAREQLAVGTDRGIVHALDLGLVPRSMPSAAPATAAAAAHPAHPPRHAAPLHTAPGWQPGHALPQQLAAADVAMAPAGAQPDEATPMDGVVAVAVAPAAPKQAVGAS